ncbi:MAG: uroporphyrinogen-III C-methyltransferase, partial [Candidatus Latescibacterota bacterium]
MASDPNKTGIVYLVGAGPGDPDLVTLRAKYLLQNCDVVVYDSLIPYELVLTLPAEIEHHYVGKEAGRHSLPQDQINELLARLALGGKRVVRLKGGDPFIFGRGGEEARYLEERGLRYEVVPGITSGVAALAYAGIPCTDRKASSFVMFVTGHKAVESAAAGAPWEWIAGARGGTLVIYMGVSEIGVITDKLLRAGMPPETPAAAVERGTFSTQRSLTTTVSGLAGEVGRRGLRPPSLFVIGEVADYHDTIKWFEKRPLFGVRVMVTRPADQAEPLYRELRELGAEVLAYPTITTEEDLRPEDWKKMRNVGTEERWLVFTSENGVRYFLKQWFENFGDIRGLKDYKIAVAGSGPVRALNAEHVEPDFLPSRTTMAALAEEMTRRLDLTRATVIRVRGNLGDDLLESRFEDAGAKVLSLHVHRTVYRDWPPEAREKLFAHPPDVLIFTSGSSVKGLARNLDAGELERLAEGALVASIGPSTS